MLKQIIWLPKKAAYVVLGVNENGYKEIFGIWIGENETAKFWLPVLTDLKNRGDIGYMCYLYRLRHKN